MALQLGANTDGLLHLALLTGHIEECEQEDEINEPILHAQIVSEMHTTSHEGNDNP